MPFRFICFITAQFALTSLLPAQVQLASDPSSPWASNGNVVAADFNGDGKPDVASFNFNGSVLSVKLGVGNGSFKPFFQQSSNGGFFLFSGDLNGDGKLDLISVSSTLNTQTATVGVSFGNGDGTFQAQVLTSLPFSADAAALGDINGDGVPDLVVANANNTLLPLLGYSNGTFTEVVAVHVPGGFLCDGLVIGDFNKDGKSDIVETCNGAQIFFGLGNARFSAPQTITAGAQQVVAADLNNDGNLDLGISYQGALSIYLNSGTGTFTESAQFPGNLGSVSFGDANGDGKLDLLAVTEDPQSVSVFPGNGDGTFQQTAAVYTASGLYPHGAQVGDFTGDGIPDILANSSDAVCVLTGLGGFAFLQPASPAFVNSFYSEIAATADFNHDGLSDVVYFAPIGISQRTQLKTAFSNGDGTFSATPGVIAQESFVPSPFNVAVADLNGDGNPDVVYVSYEMYLDVALSNPDGSSQPTLIAARVPGGFPLGAVAGDFNGDGKPDIAVLVSGKNESGETYVAVNIFPGNGNGTVGTPATMILSSGSGLGPSIVTGDFNGDGFLDIAVLSDNVVIVLTNSGTGTFRASSRTPLTYAFAMAAGDINHDGLTDLVVSTPANGFDSGYVTLLLSNAGGKSTVSSYLVGIDPQAITVADLNGDGYPEVLTENSQSQDVSIVNNKQGTLSPGGSWYSTSQTAVPLLVGHFSKATPLQVLDNYNLLPVTTK